MRLQIKSGPGAARVHGLTSPMALAAVIATFTMDRHGYPAMITAGLDGKHMVGSLHYVGCAIDMRISHIPYGEREAIRLELAADLGDDYDVVLEGDHWHIEFQPKTPYSSPSGV